MAMAKIDIFDMTGKVVGQTELYVLGNASVSRYMSVGSYYAKNGKSK